MRRPRKFSLSHILTIFLLCISFTFAGADHRNTTVAFSPLWTPCPRVRRTVQRNTLLVVLTAGCRARLPAATAAYRSVVSALPSAAALAGGPPMIS